MSGNCLGHPTIFQNAKNTLMVISIINSSRIFSFLQHHFFFCKISVTQCNLLPLPVVWKCIWSPVVYVHLRGVYGEFWSVFIVGEGEVSNNMVCTYGSTIRTTIWIANPYGSYRSAIRMTYTDCSYRLTICMTYTDC